MDEQVESTEVETTVKTRKPRKTSTAKGKAPAKGRKTAAAKGKKAPAKRKASKATRAGATTGLVQPDLSRYTKGESKTANGNPTVDIGDTTADKLRGKDLDQVYAIVAKGIKEDEKSLRAKYKHLNPGMQRMNLGNRLRGVLNAKA